MSGRGGRRDQIPPHLVLEGADGFVVFEFLDLLPVERPFVAVRHTEEYFLVAPALVEALVILLHVVEEDQLPSWQSNFFSFHIGWRFDAVVNHLAILIQYLGREAV
jgi:hypothetical protein